MRAAVQDYRDERNEEPNVQGVSASVKSIPLWKDVAGGVREDKKKNGVISEMDDDDILYYVLKHRIA